LMMSIRVRLHRNEEIVHGISVKILSSSEPNQSLRPRICIFQATSRVCAARSNANPEFPSQIVRSPSLNRPDIVTSSIIYRAQPSSRHHTLCPSLFLRNSPHPTAIIPRNLSTQRPRPGARAPLPPHPKAPKPSRSLPINTIHPARARTNSTRHTPATPPPTSLSPLHTPSIKLPLKSAQQVLVLLALRLPPSIPLCLVVLLPILEPLALFLFALLFAVAPCQGFR